MHGTLILISLPFLSLFNLVKLPEYSEISINYSTFLLVPNDISLPQHTEENWKEPKGNTHLPSNQSEHLV